MANYQNLHLRILSLLQKNKKLFNLNIFSTDIHRNTICYYKYLNTFPGAGHECEDHTPLSIICISVLLKTSYLTPLPPKVYFYPTKATNHLVQWVWNFGSIIQGRMFRRACHKIIFLRECSALAAMQYLCPQSYARPCNLCWYLYQRNFRFFLCFFSLLWGRHTRNSK